MSTTCKKITLSILGMLILLSSATSVSGREANPPASVDVVGNADEGNRASLPQNRFSIQVSAFKYMSDAEKALSRLTALSTDAFYSYEDAGSKGMWYRVYVGRYATSQEALRAAELFKKRGLIDTYMIRKTNHSDFQKQTQEAPDPTINNLIDEDPADETSAVGLSLLDAIRFSLAGNREIDVVAYAPQQAQADVGSAQAVYDPFLFAEATIRREPNLESSVVDIVTEDEGLTQAGVRKPLQTGGQLSAYLDTRYGDLNNAAFKRRFKYIVAPTVELRQPLLKNIGAKKEQTAIKIATFQAAISQADFRQKVTDIAHNTAIVYWKLFLSKALIEINRQNLAMAIEVYRRENVRLAKGISQQLDVERARSNLQSRRSTLVKSREAYRVAMDRLKLLVNGSRLNIDSDVTVIPVEKPLVTAVTTDEMQAIETALANRPEMMKAKRELMIRQVDEDLAAHQRLPTLDAFGRYRLSGYGEDFNGATDDVSPSDDDGWEVGLSFEWAMGNRSAKSLHHKKTLRRLQANAQLSRLTDDIKLDVKQVLHGIVAASGEIEATRLAKAAAEKVVQGEFARFDIGQTSNLELLRAQDLLAVNSRSLTRAIVDYNIAVHELMRVQGILPDGIAMADAAR